MKWIREHKLIAGLVALLLVLVIIFVVSMASGQGNNSLTDAINGGSSGVSGFLSSVGNGVRDNVVGLAAGVRYDIALEMGDDIGMAFALLVNEEGVHADKGFAASGHGCPREIIQLAACPADLPQPRALRVYLSVKIHRDAAVYGHHVIQLGDVLRRVHI